MKYIIYNEKKITYSDEGKGKTLVLIHGFCGDLSIWDEMLQQMDGFNIVRINLPGFGSSDAIENCSIEDMADIIYAVLKEAKVDQCFLVGHSMGGYVSLAFAKKYASHLSGLVLFHSHPYVDMDTKKANRQKEIEFIERNGHILYVKQLVPKLFSQQFIRSNAFLMNTMIFNASTLQATGITNGLRAMINRPDQQRVLEQMDCPVLFIIGRLDGIISIDRSFSQTALPSQAEVQILERSSHMGMLEEKNKSRKILERFIARH